MALQSSKNKISITVTASGNFGSAFEVFDLYSCSFLVKENPLKEISAKILKLANIISFNSLQYFK